MECENFRVFAPGGPVCRKEQFIYYSPLIKRQAMVGCDAAVILLKVPKRFVIEVCPSNNIRALTPWLQKAV
jgi:hypothetical protein